MKTINYIVSIFCSFFWEFLCIRLIWEKILPAKESEHYKRPSSFLFWVIGIYISLYGLTSNLFDSEYKIVEEEINFIFSQQNTENWKSAIEQIPIVQKTLLPSKPDFFKPLSVIGYFLFNPKFNERVLKRTKEIIIANKSKLVKINLRNIDLSGVNLMYAKFDGSNLENANLSKSLLVSSSFKDCYLSNAIFNQSILCSSSFENAFLYKASFNNCILKECGATFIESNVGIKHNVISKDILFSRDYLGANIINNANLVDNMKLIICWKNESINFESEKIFKNNANFDRSVLGEAIWSNGKKCTIESIGSCKFKDS